MLGPPYTMGRVLKREKKKKKEFFLELDYYILSEADPGDAGS